MWLGSRSCQLLSLSPDLFPYSSQKGPMAPPSFAQKFQGLPAPSVSLHHSLQGLARSAPFVSLSSLSTYYLLPHSTPATPILSLVLKHAKSAPTSGLLHVLLPFYWNTLPPDICPAHSFTFLDLYLYLAYTRCLVNIHWKLVNWIVGPNFLQLSLKEDYVICMSDLQGLIGGVKKRYIYDIYVYIYLIYIFVSIFIYLYIYL